MLNLATILYTLHQLNNLEVFWSYYSNFIPEFLIGSAIIIFILFKAFKLDTYKKFTVYALTTVLTSACLVIYNILKTPEDFLYASFTYSINNFSNVFKLLMLLLIASVLILASVREKIEKTVILKTTSRSSEYLVLILFGALIFSVIISSNDLFLTYISLEGLSLLTSIFIIGYGPIFKSSEAAIKYFSISAFTAGFVLFGISLLYKKIQTTNYTEIHKYVQFCIENNRSDDLS